MGQTGDGVKLEFRVLGTSAAFAGKSQACSSYLLAWRGRHYLIDAGPGSFSVLQNYMPYRELGGVFLSHLHADHISDIYTIRYAVLTAQKEGRMVKPLPLCMPRHPKRTFRFVRGVVRKEFRIVRSDEKLSLDLDGLEVRFLRTSHPIEAYAMRFTAPREPAEPGEAGGSGGSAPGGSAGSRRSLVYTADTGLFPGLVRFCEGARVLVAEATLQNRDRELERLGHMTAERAGELARSSGAGTLVLTHVWPEYDRALSVEESKRAFSGPVLLADRGLSLSV